jgi:photosystem II stability/assembly factor-like uncharacterized protein
MKRLAWLLALWALSPAGAFAETWTPVSSGTSNTINSLFFVSADTGWIAGENSLIRKTVDGGATWTAQPASGNIKAIRFVNSRVGWAVGESSGAGLVLKTTDGGTHWITQIDSGPVVWDVQAYNEEIAWIAGAGGFLRYTRDSGATWTTDGGNTWPIINSGTNRDIRRLWLHNAGALNGFVGSQGLVTRRLFEENNPLITDSSTTNDLHDVTFNRFPHDSGWCVGAQGTILRSTEAGVNWTVQNSGTTADLHAVSFVTTRAGYAAGANGVLLRTTDAGETWVAVNSGTTNALRAASINVVTGGWIAGDLGAVFKLTSMQPLSLRYGIPAMTAGIAIKPMVPTVMGTGPMRYSVSPALPLGLILDTITGIISGTPTTEMPATSYNVTATNPLGSITVSIRITVLKAPTLTYSNHAPQYTVGAPIPANLATLVRPSMTWDRWEVTPALPPGLKLDTMRNGGDITGTPTLASPSKDYLVTAIISNGAWVSVTLNITVANPTSISSRSSRPNFGFTPPGGTPVRFEVPGTASQARVGIFSLQAREVWTSVHPTSEGLVWNGKATDGKELSSGVYSVRIVWRDREGKPVGSAAKRFTLLRP